MPSCFPDPLNTSREGVGGSMHGARVRAAASRVSMVMVAEVDAAVGEGSGGDLIELRITHRACRGSGKG